MAKVTIDIYSGRENPTVDVTGDDEEQLYQALTQASSDDFTSRVSQASVLGFRGIYVDKADDSNSRFSVVSDDETALYLPASAITDSLKNSITQALSDSDFQISALSTDFASPVSLSTGGGSSSGSGSPCATAPPYDPNNWNVDPTTRYKNNCYNFACATPTNTFAQPGRGSGSKFTVTSCPDVSAASVRDGLVSMPDQIQCLADGFLVALVIADSPGFIDFHWYRMGDDGMWTHKPGHTPATNVDNSGNPISDPRTADRGLYSQFCGFFCVKPSSITIN